jgi:hypothetical protein
MGFLDDLQNKASDLLGGSDVAGNVEDLTNSAQDAGGAVTDQVTQYAEEHNISIEAAKEHFLGNKQ